MREAGVWDEKADRTNKLRSVAQRLPDQRFFLAGAALADALAGLLAARLDFAAVLTLPIAGLGFTIAFAGLSFAGALRSLLLAATFTVAFLGADFGLATDLAFVAGFAADLLGWRTTVFAATLTAVGFAATLAAGAGLAATGFAGDLAGGLTVFASARSRQLLV